jgi:hypothetical protein
MLSSGQAALEPPFCPKETHQCSASDPRGVRGVYPGVTRATVAQRWPVTFKLTTGSAPGCAADRLGSVAALIDDKTVVAESYRYDPTVRSSAPATPPTTPPRVSGDQSQMSGPSSSPRHLPRLSAIALLVLLAAASLGCGGTAHGSHPPGADERRVLGSAVSAYLEHGAVNHCCVPGLRARPTVFRVSSSDKSWASVAVNLTDSSGHPVQPVLVVLHKTNHAWKIFNFGTGLLGCAVPAPVQKDLRLAVPKSGCS